MNGLTRIIVAAVAIIAPAALFAQAAQAPDAVAHLAHLQAELRRAHEGGDYAAYLATSRLMYSFLNGSPRAVLQLMSAQSLAGKPDEALRSFAEFVALGQANEEVFKAKAFDPLRGLTEYQSIYASMAANTLGKSAADEVIRLQSNVRVPEDIDYDRETRHFYISTVLGKQILRVSMDGATQLFADAPDGWPMMALKIDSRRRILWATEVALDGFTAAAKTDWGRSAILQYDLRSGKLLLRIEGPPKAALGDMVLALNGDSIVSDGEHGGVYRVSRGSHRLQRIDAGDFISPQTPVALPDGTHLLVPDYVRGIGVLDLNTKQVGWIPTQGKYALSGIDGLYAFGNTLLATQNGTSPERIVRFTVNTPRTRVLSESVIERATPTLGDPTHGVVIGDYFYYIANSGWDSLDEHGVVKEHQTMPTPSLMRAKLTGPAEG